MTGVLTHVLVLPHAGSADQSTVERRLSTHCSIVAAAVHRRRMSSSPSADALSQVRAILRDTRMPTAPSRASASAQLHSRHGLSVSPSGTWPEVRPQAHCRAEDAEAAQEAGAAAAVQTLQAAAAAAATRLSGPSTAERQRLQEEEQAEAEEQSGAARRRRGGGRSQPQAPRLPLPPALPVSSSTRFFSLLEPSGSGSASLDAERRGAGLPRGEAGTGRWSRRQASREKLRREMEGDGLGDIFELVEAIETRMPRHASGSERRPEDAGSGVEGVAADAEREPLAWSGQEGERKDAADDELTRRRRAGVAERGRGC